MGRSMQDVTLRTGTVRILRFPGVHGNDAYAIA